MTKQRIVLLLLFSLVISLSAKMSTEDIVYLHPKPGAQYAHPQTNLILRLKEGELSVQPQFSIVGSESGAVTGFLKTSDQPNLFLFYPDSPFQPQETVSVTLTLDDQKMSYQFTTCVPASQPFDFNVEEYSKPSSESGKRSLKAAGEPTILSNGVSVPSDFPYIDVMVNENPAPGKIFLNNWSDSNPYNIMFNADGTPYWYIKTVARQRDFKVQLNGLLSARYRPNIDGISGGAFIAYDSTYAVVDTFLAAPGYQVDEHELRVLENGHFLVIALDYRLVDMSEFFEDGREEAGVAFSHLQEFDSDGNLILHFDTQESLNIADYTQIEEHVKNGGRFPHMNAIDIDDDNNLIFSCRHMSAVYKIQRETGEIIWKLGGINSDFTFINDPLNGFSAQHAARVLGDNRYILFDNGNMHNPRTSRAVEYELDLDAMTATMVWEYRQDPNEQYSHYMGNAQRLPNGNTLINWAEGGRPKATEVTPDGTKVYEMNFVNHYDCYRTYKFDWNVPAVRPYLIIESGGTGATLLFNQFGDVDVDYYNIYHGNDTQPTTVLDSSKLTMKTIDKLENNQYHYFRVTSVSKTGEESDYSNEEVVFFKHIAPGEEQILNGDFSDESKYWGFGYFGYMEVNGSVQDGVYHLNVSSFEGPFGSAFLFQYPVEILKDESYVYQFDAWADQKLQIVPIITSENGNSDFSRIGAIQVTTEPKHYSYEFMHTLSSKTDALAAFAIEMRTGDLYVDNVSLRQIVTSVEENAVRPDVYRLEKNYPNPFNAETTLKFSIPYQSKVSFVLYDILGRQIKEIQNKIYQPGHHQLTINDESLSSGVYFCRVEAAGKDGTQTFEQVIKMVLMK
ncbi:aryl-sulfate sulfotransferase [bacterium]